MKVVQYKCPNCNANLEFKAGEQNFGCDYCESAFTGEQLAEIYPQKEQHSFEQVKQESPAKTAEDLKQEREFCEFSVEYNCPSCGASVVTECNTAATHCVYCLSPVIIVGRLSGDYKPSKLIPFKETRESAAQKFKEYCRKRWFIPSDFRSGAHLHEMSAIYVPYWISDCTTGGGITANCKKIRSWVTSRYKYTETKEYIAVRSGVMNFSGIPHNASTRTCNDMMECIEPFNYSDTIDFKMSYLSGYIAEKYDVTKEQVYPRVRERAIQAATDTFRSTISGYNTVDVTHNGVDLCYNKWEHFLLPVWFLTYKHKDKYYHFAVNGQTGKFAGDLPIVKAKVALAAGVAVTIANIAIGVLALFV